MIQLPARQELKQPQDLLKYNSQTTRNPLWLLFYPEDFCLTACLLSAVNSRKTSTTTP